MREEQFTGAIVGLAVGDALGYPAEFRRRAQLLREIGPEGITGFLALKDPRFSRPMILGPDHPPGTYTDDTQMSIAVARGLLAAGDGSLDGLMEEIGRHFVRWSRSPDNNRAPGETCMTGCRNLEHGADFAACWARLPGMLGSPPEAALAEGGLGEAWVAEEAVASALYCVWRHPDDPRAALLEAVNTDGDSDSIGAIAGAVLGARLGLAAIPAEWVAGVEDREQLHRLGSWLWQARTARSSGAP